MSARLAFWLHCHRGPVLLIGLAALTLACGFGAPSSVSDSNAYWNAPTPSPIPTQCIAGDPPPTPPGCDLCTPAPPEVVCTTPVPTATPYFRWTSPGDRGSQSTYYQDQDVRIGALRLTLQGYTTRPLGDSSGDALHLFQFDTQNESTAATLDVQWPLQTVVKEIDIHPGTPDEQVIVGAWYENDRGERAAGLALWRPERGIYQPNERRAITIAIAAPAGRAHAIGFLTAIGAGVPPTRGPTPGGPAAEPLTIWFLPQGDPYAPGVNASGPGRAGVTTAYPKPLPTPASVRYGYFAGWPVTPNGGWAISQGFGCTDYRELTCASYPPACRCYDLDPSKPFFHFGVDVAVPRGTPLYSVLYGRVTYVGPSSGRYCDFGEPPHENLGLIVQLQTPDGAFVVKYGHLSQALATIGELAQPGTLLGLSGNSGCSSGPHLHLQITDRNNIPQPPLLFIGPPRS
jgi:murein DD-endopeptidase MepM/ murein hydrolase activator NlpD